VLEITKHDERMGISKENELRINMIGLKAISKIL